MLLGGRILTCLSLCVSVQPEEEPDPEERDHFLQQLYKFMEDRGETVLVISLSSDEVVHLVCDQIGVGVELPPTLSFDNNAGLPSRRGGQLPRGCRLSVSPRPQGVYVTVW